MELLSRARNDFHFGRSILIALVLIVLPFSSYSVAAAPSWQPFGAGGAGWEVLNEYNNVTYRFNGLERLSYNPGYEQWYQKGQLDAGYWSTLGSQGQSSTFIGDGKEHSIGSGWTYMYNGSNTRKQDSAWFSLNGNYRLAYNYTEGQWWQKGTDWSKVGSAGLSAAFIGDGTDRSIGAGWSYMYNGTNARKQDSAWFSLNGNYRLAYNYTEGQWWQKGVVDWSKLGSSGISTTFIGDGTDRSIGAGWSYMYNGSNARKQDSAWLSYNGSCRLAYNYTEGQWWQKGVVDWSKLGGSGISSTFIGDGTDRSIGDGWSYRYNASNSMKQDSVWFGFNSSYGQASNNNGSFAQASNNICYLFAYNCTEGQWWQKGVVDWSKLGGGKVSSTFIADGNYHDLKDGWSYIYNKNSGIATYKDQSGERFRYETRSGQWQHLVGFVYAPPGATRLYQWLNIGNAGSSIAFLGDGNYHTLWGKDFAAYKYSYLGFDTKNPFGFWSTRGVPGDDEVKFDYVKSEWTTFDANGVPNNFLFFPDDPIDMITYAGEGLFVCENFSYWMYPTNRRQFISTLDSPGRKSVEYKVWNGKEHRETTFGWWNYNPGADMRWSGGSLNLAVVNSNSEEIKLPPGNIPYDCPQQSSIVGFTKEDVLVMEYPFPQTPLTNIIDNLSFLRKFYGHAINNIAVFGHGNDEMFLFGEAISTDNYKNFKEQFEDLGSILAGEDGVKPQIQLLHCLVGDSDPWNPFLDGMLGDIASWTGSDIYANKKMTTTKFDWFSQTIKYSEKLWNRGFKDVSITADWGYKSSNASSRKELFQFDNSNIPFWW